MTSGMAVTAQTGSMMYFPRLDARLEALGAGPGEYVCEPPATSQRIAAGKG